jgi:hypothetical protein
MKEGDVPRTLHERRPGREKQENLSGGADGKIVLNEHITVTSTGTGRPDACGAARCRNGQPQRANL